MFFELSLFSKIPVLRLARIFPFILMLLNCSLSFSQLNQNGIPFIRNYSSKEYNAQGMNYTVIMDSRGLVYVGNDEGILRYDGTNWLHIPVSNNSSVKSLAVDSNNIVYVGSVGDFGYLAPDKNGFVKYNSLLHLIDTSQVKISNIWQTYVTKNGIYYCSIKKIFHFRYPEYLKVIDLPEGCFFSFNLGNRIIIGNYLQGMLELKGDKVELMPGVEDLVDQDIVRVTPFRSNQWMVLTYNGIYTYDLNEKKATFLKGPKFIDNTNQNLVNSRPYNVTPIKDIGFAFATINNGIMISDKKVNLTDNFNVSTGLIDESVSDIYYNPSQGVMFSTFVTGISHIEYISPFRIFGKESNLNGKALSAIRYNGTLYTGKVTGLSYLTFKENGLPWFVDVERLKGNSVFALITVDIGDGKTKLMACAGDDIYEINGTSAYPIGATSIVSYNAVSSKHKKGTMYVGCSKGIWEVKYNNGKWDIEDISKVEYEVFSVAEDNKGNIWAASSINGIIKVDIDKKVTVYTTKDGLPSISDLSVYYMTNNDKLICGSRHGLYEFNYSKNRFERSSVFGNLPFQKSAHIKNIYNGYLGSKILIVNNRIQKVTPHYESFIADSVSFNRLPEMSVENVFSESNGITWLCTSEGLISFNNLFRNTDADKTPVFISSVKLLQNDSSIFEGNFIEPRLYGKDTLWVPVEKQSPAQSYVLPYRFNNLVFTFSYPYFQDEASNSYSFFLEGFDETWSRWSHESKATFTNLGEGSYIFHVKARNVFGQESKETLFSFTILPPWYRTIWAYIGYIIIGLFILIVTVKLYTRKLEADKKRLEGIVAERTAEVVKQKDEILEKNKEIEHKNKDITDSIVYAKRIQEALLPVKDQINITNIEFFVYFRPKDIVSGDFYFIRQLPRSNMLIAAAADCTGHGVPGAFMSMLGMSFLNELIAKPEIQNSDVLLNHLREHIIVSLNPKGKETETKDGMDISLIAYNYQNNHLEWSGANNPLYLIRNGELTEFKPDKMPIGLHDRRNEPFKREELQPLSGDVIYLFSDGFEDQFGGEKGKKYMSKNMKQFLVNIHNKPMEEQERLIGEESTRWRGPIEQIDDQIIMGIKFL